MDYNYAQTQEMFPFGGDNPFLLDEDEAIGSDMFKLFQLVFAKSVDVYVRKLWSTALQWTV